MTEKNLSAVERIEMAVIKLPSGCWVWLKSEGRGGYGMLHIFGECRLAHRVSYEAFIGLIPKGMFVCHRCDIPQCCNPEHLFLGTAKDNAQDRDRKNRFINWGARITHCPKGHEYTAENTSLYKGSRGCRACKRAIAKAYYYAKKTSRT